MGINNILIGFIILFVILLAGIIGIKINTFIKSLSSANFEKILKWFDKHFFKFLILLLVIIIILIIVKLIMQLFEYKPKAIKKKDKNKLKWKKDECIDNKQVWRGNSDDKNLDICNHKLTHVNNEKILTDFNCISKDNIQKRQVITKGECPIKKLPITQNSSLFKCSNQLDNNNGNINGYWRLHYKHFKPMDIEITETTDTVTITSEIDNIILTKTNEYTAIGNLNDISILLKFNKKNCIEYSETISGIENIYEIERNT